MKVEKLVDDLNKFFNDEKYSYYWVAPKIIPKNKESIIYYGRIRLVSAIIDENDEIINVAYYWNCVNDHPKVFEYIQTILKLERL